MPLDTATLPPHAYPMPAQTGHWRRSLAFMRNPLEGLHPKVYRTGLTIHQSMLIKMHVLTDPVGIAEVLSKKSRHFKKSKLNQRIIEPVTKEGLITTHNAQWKRQRKAIAPIFRPRHMETFSENIRESIDEFMGSLNENGAPVLDAKSAMSDVTFDILARALLGNPQGVEGEVLREAANMAISTAGKLRMDDFLPLPDQFPRLLGPKARRAIHILRKGAHDILSERQQDTQDDLVGLLSQAGHHQPETPLTLREQVDNLIGFFIAGHESTAVALTWALYLIATHPKVQEKIQAEVKPLAMHETLAFDQLGQLNYLRAVLNETMRLYPSIPIIGREALQDTEILGQQIRRGETVIIPIYVMHRSDTYWERPLEFYPERFIEQPDLAKPNNPSFIPFGAGPRVCIGASFAITESLMFLARLLSRYQLELIGAPNITPKVTVSLRPDDEILIRLKPI